MNLITLQQLTNILGSEKQTDDLQRIDADLYVKVAELRHAIEGQQTEAGITFAARKMLDDEISSIQTTVERIYERRQVKILKYAISASLGNDVDTSSMIPDEVAMFDSILADMRRGRQAMLDRAISNNDEPQCAHSMGATPAPALAEPKTRTE